MPDVRIEELRANELDRIREIDRSEIVRALYIYEQGELRRVEADLEPAAWTEAELARITERLAPKLAAGAIHFYLDYGCRPVAQIDSQLYAENKPTDIHLTLRLDVQPG
jgi:hypothetical protein